MPTLGNAIGDWCAEMGHVEHGGTGFCVCRAVDHSDDESKRRAPVQMYDGSLWGKHVRIPSGTVAWWEHERAYEGYVSKTSQSSERIAERGGFGFLELCLLLHGAPKTWEPRA